MRIYHSKELITSKIMLAAITYGLILIGSMTFIVDSLDVDCDEDIKSICSFYLSCFAACGKTINPDSDEDQLCSCDYLCPLYKDCCFDFEAECPQELDKFNQSPLKRLASIKSKCFGPHMALSSCVTNRPLLKKPTNNLTHNSKHTKEEMMITGAVFDLSAAITTDNSNDASPRHLKGHYNLVSDITTNLTFKDKNIFRCNNLEFDDMKKWRKIFISETSFSKKDLVDFLTYDNSSDTFLNSLHDVHPETVMPRYCPPNTPVTCDVICHMSYKLTFNNVNRICKENNLSNFKQTHEIQRDQTTPFISDNLVLDEWNENDDSTMIPFKPPLCYLTVIHRDNIFDDNVLKQFAGEFELNDMTKVFNVNQLSLHFVGGWDQFICQVTPTQKLCQMTNACYPHNLYYKDRCIDILFIRLAIESKSHDSENPIKLKLKYNVMKYLRNQHVLQFSDTEYNKMSSTFENETLINVYIPKPKIVKYEREVKGFPHNFKEAVEVIFCQMSSPGVLVWSMSVCYFRRVLPDDWTHNVCEDLTLFTNLSRHGDCRSEADIVYTREISTSSGQMRITKIPMIYVAICSLLWKGLI